MADASPIQLQNLIAGQLVDPQSSQWLKSIEPATGLELARVPASDQRDVDQAVAAAGDAFESWASMPASERSARMMALASLMERDADKLADAESRDTGKPISLACAVDIPRAIANIRFFATEILHRSSKAYDTDGKAINYTLMKPRGVAGLVSPWNLPLYLLTWKIAPALAAGCAVVAKPSEITPVTAWMFSKLVIEAGFAPGVMNIVHGTGASVGAAIVDHQDVPTISFTGGTATGRAIAISAAKQFKRISLELGGKNATIVFDDAELDQAAAQACRAGFTNQGQVCTCGSRILVQASIYESFLEKLTCHVAELTVGDPMDHATNLGSLISLEHRVKVDSFVQLARKDQGSIICGGKNAPAPNERCAGGAFYEPTLITGLEMSCRVQQEEIFGPVVTVTPFTDEAHAVELANATPFGLCANVWTGNVSRAHRVAASLDVGMVWVNCWMLRDLRTPFGGARQSGLGREGGTAAIAFFSEPKNVCIAVSDAD